jgi:hypothetical protein
MSILYLRKNNIYYNNKMAKLKKRHVAGLVILLLILFVGVPLGIFFYSKSRNNTSSEAASNRAKLKNLPQMSGVCSKDGHCPKGYYCHNGNCLKCNLNANDKDLNDCVNSGHPHKPPPAPQPQPSPMNSCVHDCDCPNGACGENGLCTSCDNVYAGTPNEDCCFDRVNGRDTSAQQQNCYNDCMQNGGNQALCKAKCISTCTPCNGGGGDGGCYRCMDMKCQSFTCPPQGSDPGFKYYMGMGDCMADCRGSACDSSMDCNYHGSCQNGYCICNQGWTGRQCAEPVKKK